MFAPEPPWRGWKLVVALLGVLFVGVAILSAAGLLGFLLIESFRYL